MITAFFILFKSEHDTEYALEILDVDTVKSDRMNFRYII